MVMFDIYGILVDENADVYGHGPVRSYDGALVMPGFVNAHSHAFQRALRGRVEVRGTGENANDDFWSWRNAMYADAARLTPADVEALATWCYADMLRSGFTTVGEFHYLHHDEKGQPYAQPEMSLALVRAAKTVGIRLTLLETAYARGGVNKSLTDAQRRFAFPSHDAFALHVEKVRELVKDEPNVNVGVAIHSVRACPRDWIEAISLYAAKRQLPLHVHACEQRKELDECRFEHGMSPLALLSECGALTFASTVVHATHIEPPDFTTLHNSGATVCLTPSTERNLGDGMCPISALVEAGVPLCIGTDSHARIDVADELRSLEDHERLRTECRNVLMREGARLAETLLPRGARAGFQSLQWDDDDAILQDRVIIPMPIEGRAGGALVGADAWLVGGSGRDVKRVEVGGAVVVDDGVLISADPRAIEERALAVLQKLAAV